MTEREKTKQKRKMIVIHAAYELFLNHKIENTSIQEIADKADIGVASVYRYFANKNEIAVEVAIMSWNLNFNPLLQSILDNKDDGIASLMQGYIALFDQNPEFFRYLEDFDNFISKVEQKPKSISLYEEMMGMQDELMIKLLIRDREKGLLRDDIDSTAYMNMAGQTVMALAQKLLNRGHVIAQDENIDARAMLLLLVETLYNNIKKDKKL